MNATINIADRVLSRSRTENPYCLRLAASPADVRNAQTLRFLVFNVELNEGLEGSYATLLDADQFDEICDHLLVEDTRTGDVVGTYRMQTGPRAASGLGYYSAQIFDLRPLEPMRGEILELGRACVHAQHRNLTVLGMLWKGIADYAREKHARYLIGCSSVTTQDEGVGAAMFENLSKRHLAPDAWRVNPQPSHACSRERIAENPPKVPKLLAAYLSIGAAICGPPAIDREFKTVDFLTFLDLRTLPEATIRRFLI
jgi:putative hemolysin